MIEETTETSQFLQDLPPQLDPLRSFLEANLQPHIKIQAYLQFKPLDVAAEFVQLIFRQR